MRSFGYGLRSASDGDGQGGQNNNNNKRETLASNGFATRPIKANKLDDARARLTMRSRRCGNNDGGEEEQLTAAVKIKESPANAGLSVLVACSPFVALRPSGVSNLLLQRLFLLPAQFSRFGFLPHPA
jgi:hypothetical protein